MYLLELLLSRGVCSVVGLLSHIVDLVLGVFFFFFFYEISVLLSLMAVLVYIPTKSAGGFPFLHILSRHVFVDFLMVAILTGVR